MGRHKVLVCFLVLFGFHTTCSAFTEYPLQGKISVQYRDSSLGEFEGHGEFSCFINDVLSIPLKSLLPTKEVIQKSSTEKILWAGSSVRFELRDWEKHDLKVLVKFVSHYSNKDKENVSHVSRQYILAAKTGISNQYQFVDEDNSKVSISLRVVESSQKLDDMLEL